MSATLAAAACLFRAVHVGDHRDAVGVLDRLQDAQAVLEARAAEGMNRGAVGLVVGRFEHKGNAQALAHLLVVAGAVQGEVEILEHVHAAQQGEGLVVGEGDAAELDRTRCHHRASNARRSLPTLMRRAASDSLQP